MSVKKRLIPKLLITSRKSGGDPVLVTTRQFQSPRLVGDPVSQARIYESQLADELIVLNIGRKPLERNGPMVCLVRSLASQTFMPLTVGGGVAALGDIEMLLENGADKVALTTSAIDQPELVTAAARVFGAQCVVVGLDCRTGAHGGHQIAADRARAPTDRHPVSFAREMIDRGAGELLVTNVDRDGVGLGLDLELGQNIARAVEVPVILSGGAGLAAHFVDAFTKTSVEAVASGTFFAFRDQNPMQARSHIANAGVKIRMLT